MRHLLSAGLLLAAGAWALATVSASEAVSPRPRAVVFFQEWSAQLDDAAKGVIADAAEWAKQHPDAPVRVLGYADPTGSKEANRLLTLLRAQMVIDALESDGVDAARMQREGEGSVNYADSSQESRRVEIIVEP
jgi:outer membrane protein OmpA-like peptidoglycan-associated protein